MKTPRLPILALAGALALLPAATPLPAAPTPMDLARQLNQAFVEVADTVSPAVVVVRVAHKPDFADAEEHPFLEFLPPEMRRQWEQWRERQQRPRGREERGPRFDGQGSGVVIREDGYIMTNRHVVDGAEKIKVRFKDGRELDGVVRGVDAQSDIAVIKIEAKGLPVAKLGDSDKVRVGEFAIAIGAPFDLDYSVTIGHVSAKGRSRIVPDPSMDQDFIQTDASINPGNSGGPLVNINGEVIGINTMIRGLNTGIGFAVPVNLAREVANRLISDGKYTRSWLGVSIEALSESDLKNRTKDISQGVVVKALVPDGPGAKSELRPADIITTVDGRPVGTAQQLKNEIRSKPTTKDVTLDVVRGDKKLKIKVRPEAWPDEEGPLANSTAPSKKGAAGDLGLTVKPLTKELANQFGVDQTQGVIVTEVSTSSSAAAKGIQAGDIITEVNHKPVTSPKAFRDALNEADLKKGVIVNLISKGVSKFHVLKTGAE